MKRGLVTLTLLAFGAFSFTGTGAFAAMAKQKLPDKPLAAETAFVQQVTTDLNSRYPTPAAAEKAGYFRYNNEDNTGAISYVNTQQWNSATDSNHPQPSQLWYDVKGRLLGADYSVPVTASAPKLWNIDPGRWFRVSRPHVHYVLTGSGNAAFGHAVGGSAFTKAGGNLSDPQAATLVKMGKVKTASQVVKVFTFPAQWNLELWVTPNPLGAFAEKNPLVHPSSNAAKGEM